MHMELNVKVGDKLLYCVNNWGRRVERIVTVKKITPTGRIRVEGVDSQFDKYGSEMGGDVWTSRAHLSIPTKEDYKRIEENMVISKALSLVRDLNETILSYDKALKIIEILKETEE